jgi:putative ABC transport system permease protein
MIRNYLKIAFRNLGSSKTSAFINIIGLAAGMAVAMLIGLWVYDECSFNKSHQHYDRIAQVMQNQTFNGEIMTWSAEARQLGPELRGSYGSNFKYVVTASWTDDHLLSFGDKKITNSGNFMEPDITSMLSLTMLRGSKTALKNPGSILLSRSVANAFFGQADPTNQLMKIDNKLDVKVAGVYENLPNNSSFANLNFIAPWELLARSENFESRQVDWGNSWFQTFVQIADHADMAKVSAAIRNAKLNKASTDDARFKPVIFLQPMSRWHLYSDFKNGINIGGRIQYVWLFGIIGFFVLVLACINFMNLSTARSEKRAKEVGIRKAIGCVRSQLMTQFFSESLLVVFFAFCLSLLLVLGSLGYFNEVADKKISILWGNPFFWLAGLGFSLITGLLAGSYPALYLSSFRAVSVLKGNFKVGPYASIPRKVLVVVQFTVSLILIIGTVVVFRQIQFAKNRPIGYNNAGLVSIPIKTDNIQNHFEAFRNDLLRTGTIKEISASESPVTAVWVTNSGYDWPGKDPGLQEEFWTVGVTREYGKTIGWKIKEGRDFSADFPSDSAGFIINEAAVKYMGLKNPVGQVVKWNGNGNFRILAVVNDLLMQSPYEPVKQTIFYINYHRLRIANIKIKPEFSAPLALSKISAVFKKYDPSNPFEYRFADQEYATKFENEERISKLASFFAALAILISCLGLFGLASFVAEQRTKEIGIRKVLGATVLNVWGLLSKDFMVLVFISLFISSPLAYYFMHNWLQNFTYHTPISSWIFGAAAIAAIAITLLTVSFQSIKAAVANPVKSLRTQ